MGRGVGEGGEGGWGDGRTLPLWLSGIPIHPSRHQWACNPRPVLVRGEGCCTCPQGSGKALVCMLGRDLISNSVQTARPVTDCSNHLFGVHALLLEH